MAVKIRLSQDEVCACLLGDIDHHTARQMREEIDAAIQRAQPKHLVLDFRDVPFMDSSGIGLVMGRYRLMLSFGGDVRLANVPQRLQKVMRLAGLDKLAMMQDGGQDR